MWLERHLFRRSTPTRSAAPAAERSSRTLPRPGE